MRENPLIVALDVSSKEEALVWVKRLQGNVGFFKVGMQLFYQEGPAIVKSIQDAGGQVFLDLKLHDIPNQVANACDRLKELQVALLTVHTSGGEAMLKAAQQAVAGSETQLLGVTVLTSMDTQALTQVYLDCTKSPLEQAVHLAGIAKQAGLYGVVCSAQENQTMQATWGEELALVNPGIRPSGSAVNDQKRVVTPSEAMVSGARYLVVGRPILQAHDPVAVVKSILEECQYEPCVSS